MHRECITRCITVRVELPEREREAMELVTSAKALALHDKIAV